MRIAILLALVLAGCVEQKVTRGLTRLIGQDIHVAVQKLGYPATEHEILGDKVYLWTMSGTESASSNGAFCTIEIAASQSGIIKTYHLSGNDAGCRVFVDALDD